LQASYTFLSLYNHSVRRFHDGYWALYVTPNWGTWHNMSWSFTLTFPTRLVFDSFLEIDRPRLPG
jgi:hypothetical protein